MIKLIIYSIAFTFCLSVNADDDLNFPLNDQYSQSTNGGIGLIETPTARFSNDGELVFGISSEAPFNQLYAKMQFFPWLEAVVKYTELTTRNYNTQTYKDKGFDLKVKVFDLWVVVLLPVPSPVLWTVQQLVYQTVLLSLRLRIFQIQLWSEKVTQILKLE